MSKRRRKGCLFFILLVAIALGAFFTNPNEQMHRDAAKEKLDKIAGNMLEKYGINPRLLSVLGIDSSAGFVDELIKKHVSANNYLVLSTTMIRWDDRSQLVGIGAFGRVYISARVEEIMQRELEKYLKEKIEEIKIPGINLENFNLEPGL